jgi:hypothetical protein
MAGAAGAAAFVGFGAFTGFFAPKRPDRENPVEAGALVAGGVVGALIY